MPDFGVPRLSVEIEPETKRRLDDLIAWGQLKPIINVLVDDLINLLEPLNHRDREITKALIISRRVKTTEIFESLRIKED